MKKKVIIAALAVTALIGITQYKGNETTTVGKFYGSIEAADIKGNVDTYYHFKANDNAVWWMFTEEELGFVPKGNAEYIVTYDDNGTTETNKPCDCAPELECECEVYDDIFIAIKEVKGK